MILEDCFVGDNHETTVYHPWLLVLIKEFVFGL